MRALSRRYGYVGNDERRTRAHTGIHEIPAGVVDRLCAVANDAGRVDQYDEMETADITWRPFQVRVTPAAPPSEKGDYMGNRVFSIKPRDLQALFMAWGWEMKGSADHNNATHFLLPATGCKIPVYGPKAKRYESGNANAIKAACKEMGMSIAEFLVGPPDEQKQPQPDLDLAALERAEAQRVAHEKEQEDMVDIRRAKNADISAKAPGKWPTNVGYTDAITEYLKANAGRWITSTEVERFLRATKFPEIPTFTVAGILSQKSRVSSNTSDAALIVSKKNPHGRGNVYQYDPEKFERVRAAKEEEHRAEMERRRVEREAKLAKDRERKRAERAAAKAEREAAKTAAAVVEHSEQIKAKAPTPVQSNGIASIFEKVTPIADGQYLFTGDDGKLYIGSMTKLPV